MGSGERGRAGAVVAVGGVVLLSLFFFCGMVVGHLFWCFCFIHFWRVVVWEPLVWRFCWAGGSRLWCVAWCGGCVPSLSGFIGSIVDFTFFVYGDKSCLLFMLVEQAGVFCVFGWCFFLCGGWEFVGERVWCVLFGVWWGGGRFRVCCGMVGCTIVGFL